MARALIWSVVMSTLLSSCNLLQSQQATDATVIYGNGGCMFIVDGLSLEKLDEKREQWDFEDCKVSINSESD